MNNHSKKKGEGKVPLASPRFFFKPLPTVLKLLKATIISIGILESILEKRPTIFQYTVLENLFWQAKVNFTPPSPTKILIIRPPLPFLFRSPPARFFNNISDLGVK